MMQKNSGDIKRIEHSLKVFAYAQLPGIAESFDENTLGILELTALLHNMVWINTEFRGRYVA